VRSSKAFTLIELLVVMAIIGIIAALVISLAGRASSAKRIALVKAELSKLETVIDSYHAKLGYYPPDNGNLITEDSSRPSAATNALFYELTGAAYDSSSSIYRVFDNSVIAPATVKSYFNREGIVNSIESRNFFLPPPKANQHKDIGSGVHVLVVPVDLQPGQINPWKYDCSSTNRHNPESYDLWADFSAGGKTVTKGNWKE
jgi:prepilin-type N-terminal cleavage/methylation domain-containing protein